MQSVVLERCAMVFWLAAFACGSNGYITEDDFTALDDAEQEAKQRIQYWIETSRMLQEHPLLPADRADALTNAIESTRSALSNYNRLRDQGGTRAMIIAPIQASAGAIVADDATGIGVGDDVLLVPLALAAIATYAITDARASSQELGRAWNRVLSTSGALGREVDAALISMSEAQGDERPRLDDCVANVARCLGTRLGRRGTGRSPGHSICSDCLEVCQGDGAWPDFGRDGKNCQWWLYEHR